MDIIQAIETSVGILDYSKQGIKTSVGQNPGNSLEKGYRNIIQDKNRCWTEPENSSKC